MGQGSRYPTKLTTMESNITWEVQIYSILLFKISLQVFFFLIFIFTLLCQAY